MTPLAGGTRGKGRRGASQLPDGQGDSPAPAQSSPPCYSCHGPLRTTSASPRIRAQAHDKDKREPKQDGTKLISRCVTYVLDFLASQEAHRGTHWSKQGPVSAKHFISHLKCPGWQSCKGEDYSLLPSTVPRV